MKPRLARWTLMEIVLGIALLASLVRGTSAQSVPALADAATSAPPPAPIGALWVPASSSYYGDRLHLDRFIADLKATPFTEIILQVRAEADAYYQSDLAPRASGVPKDVDPLDAVIKALHAGPNPKKVIAWIDPYHAGNLNEAAPLGPTHVLMTHQDWLSLREDRDSADRDGNMFLEPGLPAVQQHLEAVIKELVSKYPIDGLYIDHMGDPIDAGNWGYHPDVVARWVQQKGLAGAPPPSDPQWRAFRAGILTQALKGFIAAAHAARPGLMVAVDLPATGQPPANAANFNQSAAYAEGHQDLPAWLQLDGLSRVYVRDFHSDQTGQDAFNQWVALALALEQGHTKAMVIGVSGKDNQALDALAQLRRAAEAGADGLALWNFEKPIADLASADLFYGAVSRTVLSPQFLQSMAVIKRSRISPVKLPIITKAQAAEDSTATIAQATPAPPITAPTTGSTAQDAAMPLPPPPTLASVPDENPDEAPASGGLPPAEGRLLSASADRATSGGVDDQTMAALDSLLGDGSPVPQATPKPISTRQQLIDDLLNDPSFRSSPSYSGIWSSEAARKQLQQKFGNIF